MLQKPPYTITEKAADFLAKIVETVTRLEFGTGFTRDIRLHRENRVRTIHASLAIEGISLSLRDVTAVLEGKVVAGKQTEIKEVKNAYEAYEKIMTFDPYSIDDFLTAHMMMTSGLVKESGKFRSGDVGVFDGDTVVHVGARPQFVPRLMEDLFGWAKESELHAVLKSAIVTIHPFEDGNGRISRALSDMLLARSDEQSYRFYSMSTQIRKERNSYYDILEKTQKSGLDITNWLEWFLNCLLHAIENSEKLLEKIIYKHYFWLKHSKININDRQRKILNMLMDDFEGVLNTTKWAKIGKCSQDTALRDIQDLI